MMTLRRLADEIIDTSDMTVHELRQFFMGLRRGRSRGRLVTTLLSFGYKNGVPVDADLVFDVRCLPNPHFVPALRRRTGRDRAVVAFMERDPSAREFMDRLEAYLRFVRAVLRRRRQELPDRRDRLHRRPSPFGDDRGADAARVGRRRRPCPSPPSRHHALVSLRSHGAVTAIGQLPKEPRPGIDPGRAWIRGTAFAPVCGDAPWIHLKVDRATGLCGRCVFVVQSGGAMIGVVVVTHGQLATELVNAAETIVGDLPTFTAVSIGWHDDVNDARDEIAQAIERVDEGNGVLVLTDMFGGTPSNLGYDVSCHRSGRSDHRCESGDADQAGWAQELVGSARCGPGDARSRPSRDLGGVGLSARREER